MDMRGDYARISFTSRIALEDQIENARQRLLRAYSTDQQLAAWREMKHLIAQRTAAEIEQLERARGLR
jgi:hypothetical protein